jgi:predicted GH43/DUF377 family glycosyl hydrolase
MVDVKKEGIILEKTALDFENEGVLNPAVIKESNTVHLFYRALRKGNHSSIGYCKLEGPLQVAERYDKPILVPQFEYESQGLEDPRIVKIEDTYYLTYTAYDGVNASVALATSKDLKEFYKQGLITPQMNFSKFICLSKCCGDTDEKYFLENNLNQIVKDTDKHVFLWDKNVVFFPKKINGKLHFLHRVRPGIQIVSINSLEDLTKEFWENYFLNLSKNILLEPKYQHESGYIGAGCPPVETKDGWILIYHGAQLVANEWIYSACAALLDLEDPLKEIARLKYPLFSPDLPWEKQGKVNNVVFPTGTALFDNRLYIYYGAADERIAVASLNFSVLLTELKNSINNTQEQHHQK